MRRVLRFLRFCLWSLLFVVALGGVLFGYYVYSPAPEVPRLSGTLAKGTINVGGLKRTYLTYLPRGLAKGAPLVVVMHGSGESSAQIRIETGYGFEPLPTNMALRSSIRMHTTAIGTCAALSVTTARMRSALTTWIS
jgi:polyhydroxybutyrate depolymerase